MSSNTDAPVAPPQSPEGVAAALAKTDTASRVPQIASDMGVMAIAGRPDLERIEAIVTIPADFQYEIKRKVKGQDVFKVGITADGYDYINRALGASFFLPEWVHDQQGEQQRNPIHRKDYIYLRLACVWYTPLGQLVMATEDVEVDFNLTWMDARINTWGAEVQTDTNGFPLFDANGQPALRLKPEDELKALKTLSQLRTFGPRYAQTVARVRLLKMATGIRSLPIDHPRDFGIKVVGYRDQLTPQDRIKKAESESQAFYGRPDDIKPLDHEEMAAAGIVEPDPDTEQIDRDAVAAAQADVPGDDSQVGPDEDERAEILEREQREADEQARAPWAP